MTSFVATGRRWRLRCNWSGFWFDFGAEDCRSNFF